jgi:hypothetical protein
MKKDCGYNSGVECQPSKLFVAGSNPVARSKFRDWLEIAVAIAICNWIALVAGIVLLVYHVIFQ